MTIRSRDEALASLGPYLERLARCIAQAWKDFEEHVSAAVRADVSPRTRAAFVNDRIKLNARREFERDRGVAFVRGRGGLFVLMIANTFLLRFKKLKPNLRSSNIPTHQATLFGQQRGLELPNMPPALTHVNAGYILNRMQTDIAATYVTCPVGKRLEWVIDLAAASQGEVVQMTPSSGQTTTRTKIVRRVEQSPKRTAEGSGEEDGGDGDN